MIYLHVYSGAKLNNPEVPVYQIPDDELQWFFDEYIRRIEEYITAKRVIDEVVMRSNIDIIGVTTAPAIYHEGTIIKYGYPFFGDKSVIYCGSELKQYYEQRLGVCDLVIDYSVFRE